MTDSNADKPMVDGEALQARIRELEEFQDYAKTHAQCAYCGHIHKSEDMAAHIVECIQHPLGQMALKLEAAERMSALWKAKAKSWRKYSDLSDRNTDHYFSKFAEALGERNAALYVPGEWHCTRCGFVLTKSILAFDKGEILANTSPVAEGCPNCNVPLERVKTLEALREARKDAIEQWKRADTAEEKARDYERDWFDAKHEFSEKIKAFHAWAQAWKAVARRWFLTRHQDLKAAERVARLADKYTDCVIEMEDAKYCNESLEMLCGAIFDWKQRTP